MPRVSAKRQITLPARQCNEAGIAPGDEFRSFVANGRITNEALDTVHTFGQAARQLPHTGAP